jgi:peptidoglycan-N-acetylglucosamine deacetylase
VVWGSVEFYKRLIRFALFYVLPGSMLALVVLLVLYFVQVGSLSVRIAQLDGRLAAYENVRATQTATPSPTAAAPSATPTSAVAPTIPPDDDASLPSDARDLPSPTPPAGTPAGPTPLALYPDLVQPVPTFAATIGKVAYLTFDDGPSARTLEILDILDRYNIHAAFFVLNHASAAYDGYLREIVRRGSVVGMHSATHDYAKVYASVESFLKEFDANYRYILGTTGIAPRIYRFPGGSNTGHAAATGAAIRAEMNARGFFYYDWNCASGDGNSANQDPLVLAQNVLATAKGKNRVIVLFHDSANRVGTVESLPMAIEGLYAQGFRIDLLTAEVLPVAFMRK